MDPDVFRTRVRMQDHDAYGERAGQRPGNRRHEGHEGTEKRSFVSSWFL